MTRISHAIVSTSNKSGLTDFARGLAQHHITLIATGNTAHTLRQATVPVTEVADYTGFPELLNGRVKTLHPKIHAGILARGEQDHATLSEHDIHPIHLVIANLYPFAQTIAQPDCSPADAVEQIDIGGPTLLRAAAKNHAHVTVIIDPADYPQVLNEISTHGNTLPRTRAELAAKVFSAISEYDQTIHHYLTHNTAPDSGPDIHPSRTLRYGENPQQAAHLHDLATAPHTLAAAKQEQGKALSYNNLNDAHAAIECIRHFTSEKAAVAIIKHATPCGVATADTLIEAYDKALQCDAQSAFGGIVACQQPIDAATAKRMQTHFFEVIIAPSLSNEARAILQQKSQCRVLTGIDFTHQDQQHTRSIQGGLLIQDSDSHTDQPSTWEVITETAPTPQQQDDLSFAWRVVREVKSNAIVIAKNGMTIGIGAGQTSRVFSVTIAGLKAQTCGHDCQGAVLASDAFFPFADNIAIAKELGITAIIQPGGSKRDTEVIAAANQAGIAMIATGTRHFKH